MNVLRLGLAGLVAVWLAGCLPESEHPIAPADPQNNDPRLWGAWLNEGEEEFIVGHVLVTEQDTLHLVIVDQGAEGIGGVDEYDAHVTRLPQGDYLNVLVTGSETGYLIVKYRFDGPDLLMITSAKDEALTKAVQSGALAGTITDEGGTPDLRITASSEQWQAYLAKAPADLFGEEMAFRRIGPAYVSK